VGTGKLIGGHVTDLGEHGLGCLGRHALGVRFTGVSAECEHGTDRGVGR